MGSPFALCLAISMLLGSVSTPDPEMAQGVSTQSPIGRWKTVDDATGKIKSVVTIWEEAGKLYGRIQKLVDPDPKDPNPRSYAVHGRAEGPPRHRAADSLGPAEGRRRMVRRNDT